MMETIETTWVRAGRGTVVMMVGGTARMIATTRLNLDAAIDDTADFLGAPLHCTAFRSCADARADGWDVDGACMALCGECGSDDVEDGTVLARIV